MEEELIKEILLLKKYYNNAELEDCTKEVLRGELGRQAMRGACNIFNITPLEYVKYLTDLAQKRLIEQKQV